MQSTINKRVLSGFAAALSRCVSVLKEVVRVCQQVPHQIHQHRGGSITNSLMKAESVFRVRRFQAKHYNLPHSAISQLTFPGAHKFNRPYRYKFMKKIAPPIGLRRLNSHLIGQTLVYVCRSEFLWWKTNQA